MHYFSGGFVSAITIYIYAVHRPEYPSPRKNQRALNLLELYFVQDQHVILRLYLGIYLVLLVLGWGPDQQGWPVTCYHIHISPYICCASK
jgi:hypothetical protein